MQASAESAAPAPASTGKLKITDLFPKELAIGVGQVEGIVKADGLFEEDSLGQVVRKKGLVAVVMKEDGKTIDPLIIVEPIATDEIFPNCIKIKITVPVGEGIVAGQDRKLVIKKRFELLDDKGQCDPKSDYCSVSPKAFKLK